MPLLGVAGFCQGASSTMELIVFRLGGRPEVLRCTLLFSCQ